MKIKIWRQDEYPTIDEAEKNGAVYTSGEMRAAERDTFLRGMELANLCICNNTVKLGVKIAKNDWELLQDAKYLLDSVIGATPNESSVDSSDWEVGSVLKKELEERGL